MTVTAPVLHDEHLTEASATEMAGDLGFVRSWWQPGLASNFFYFEDGDCLLIIAGEQSGTDVERALAYGMTWRAGRHLVLALPQDRSYATKQRAAWFTDDARPTIYEHDGHTVSTQTTRTSRADTLDTLRARIPGGDPAAELRHASTAHHLGELEACVASLTGWATGQPRLDPGHRQAYRAWHYMGQTVLQIAKGRGGVKVRAGLSDAGNAFGTVLKTPSLAAPLSASDLADCQDAVSRGVEARRTGPFHQDDEHYLQAVVRLAPHLVGIEQPALREVPAWRPPSAAPRDSGPPLNRGYVDLLGLDGSGDIRVVETKLARAKDSMLILQGLDYYVWALLCEDALRARLGAAPNASIRLTYLVGAASDGRVHFSPYAQALVDAIDHTAVKASYLGVSDWFTPDHATSAKVRRFEGGALPV